MKKIYLIITLLISFVMIVNAQSRVDKYVEITKNDGTVYIGKVISEDDREILIDTKEIGKLFIPKHEIKAIRELMEEDFKLGSKITGYEKFPTRHFITANAIPLREGEAYMLFRGIGPDFQMGVTEKLGVGVLTTWWGSPVIGSIKYSTKISKNLYWSLGALAGTGSWSLPDLYLALPFSTITSGNEQRNISLTAGYGFIGIENENEGRFLLSVAGMTKITKKLTFVLDSYLAPGGNIADFSNFYIVIPGLRWDLGGNSAIQLGFGGVLVEDYTFALPFFNWLYRF